MKFNYKKDFGNQAMIFANGSDGYLYFDRILRILEDNSLDEILNSISNDSMLVLAKNNQIPLRCAIWVENNEWHPIIKFSPDVKYCVVDDDWIFEIKGDHEEYIESQLDCCKQLANIIKNYI